TGVDRLPTALRKHVHTQMTALAEGQPLPTWTDEGAYEALRNAAAEGFVDAWLVGHLWRGVGTLPLKADEDAIGQRVKLLAALEAYAHAAEARTQARAAARVTLRV